MGAHRMKEFEIQRRFLANAFDVREAVHGGSADFSYIAKLAHELFGDGFYITARDGVEKIEF